MDSGEVKDGASIILYGAGRHGKAIYKFLKSKGYEGIIYGFCDRNAKQLIECEGKHVWLPEEMKGEDVIYCITLANEKIKEEIRNDLGKEAKYIEVSALADYIGEDRVAFNRDFCAFYHLNDMDEYFWNAENSLGRYWNENSIFYHMFRRLDLSNVIELGCGRGRHIQKYMDKAGEITLVDILQQNIDMCRERFQGNEHIHYYKNDGFDLMDLESGSYSALYTYDAMVHFEMMDIYSYLKDIYRILKKGGRALFHHSNNTRDYKYDFSSTPHARNYMSKELFAYLAYRAGFTVLEQRVIDWGDEPELDCISLVEK